MSVVSWQVAVPRLESGAALAELAWDAQCCWGVWSYPAFVQLWLRSRASFWCLLGAAASFDTRQSTVSNSSDSHPRLLVVLLAVGHV